MMNFDTDGIEECCYLVVALKRNEYRLMPKKIEFHMKHRESPPTRPSIVEDLKL